MSLLNLYSKKTQLLFSLIITILLGLIFYYSSGVIHAIVMSALSFPILWFILLLIIPNEYGKVKWRRISLAIITALSTFTISVTPLIKTFVKLNIGRHLIDKYAPLISNFSNYQISTDDLIIWGILTITLLILYMINKIIQDKSVMKAHENSFDELFPEPNFGDRLKSFCRIIENQLNQLDIDTNWSDAHFTPLDAEVEVQSGNRKLRRITNLHSAIRNDRKSKVFLVLGDPGAGKSVALRKLCKELLKEVNITYKIPIYVNLKEWQIDKKWTEKNPPTYKQFYNFVESSMKGRDVFADDFIKTYFKRLFENGHIFWIFDSFDEIPAILDENETSIIIDKLSQVCYDFLAGANNSRGILSSRFFRRPSHYFQAKTVLEIRPFTELRISEALKKYISFDSNLIDQLFRERQDLIPIASNPFSSGLISNYARDNNSLPRNKSELYNSYISKRLNTCNDKIQRQGLNKTQIIDCAIEIANYMFEKTNLGLEASINELSEKISGYPVKEIIEMLVYSRIGRIGSGDEKRFSFVHRRFNEYFVIQKLIKNPELVNLESIPTDSRYRDALVLYCEVAKEEKAKQIALFCWNEIIKLRDQSVSQKDTQYMRSIHCLRFLKDTFRTRINCIESFQDDLGTFIYEQVEENNDNILFVKIAVESVGILKEEDINLIVGSAMYLNNYWINETVIKSCRHLISLDKKIVTKIVNYIFNKTPIDFLQNKNELFFSLELSEVFRSIYNKSKYKTVDSYLFILGGVGFFLLSPILFLFAISYSFLVTSSSLMGKFPFMNINHIFKPLALSMLWIFVRGNIFSHFSQSIYIVPAFIFPITIYKLVLYFTVLSLLPYSGLILLVFNFNKIKSNITRKNIFIIFKFIIGFIVFIFSLYFIFTLKLPHLLKIILLGIAIGFVIIIILLILIFIMITEYKDYFLFKRARKNLLHNRSFVSENFIKFKTSSKRLRFVQLLQNEIKKCDGDWPEGHRPSKGSYDKASTLLAQLDEKWLGLDR